MEGGWSFLLADPHMGRRGSLACRRREELREPCGKAAGAVRESCGGYSEKLRKSCGSYAEELRKSCGSCAEKLRNSCGKAAEKLRNGGSPPSESKHHGELARTRRGQAPIRTACGEAGYDAQLLHGGGCEGSDCSGITAGTGGSPCATGAETQLHGRA